MTLQEFIVKYTGKGIDFDGSYGNQCVDLYRQYVKEVLNYPQSPGVTGAKDIWNSYLPDYFNRILNSPEGVPLPGDIMIWGALYGTFGHVAVVVSATINSFTAFSQNDPSGALCGLKTYTYKSVLGWLHPSKGIMNADEISVKKTDFENLVKKATDLDTVLGKYGVANIQELFNMVAGKDARITDLGNQLGTAQAEMKNREEQVGRLVAEIANLKSDYESLTDRYNIATGNYETAVREKAALAIELAQTKTQLETAKQGSYTLTIADLFKLIWNQKITITKGSL